MIWYGMDVWKRNAIIKAMIPRWKPAGQKPVKGNRDCNCMCILSSLAWTRHRPYSLSPLSKSRGNRQILDGKEVIVGFDRSQWSTRCASCFNRQYDYFPYYHSLDESLRKYSENWQLRNELKNQAVSQLKQEVLHGELKEERRLYTNTFRLYRFVVNPKKAIIRELKKMGTDLLTGRER